MNSDIVALDLIVDRIEHAVALAVRDKLSVYALDAAVAQLMVPCPYLLRNFAPPKPEGEYLNLAALEIWAEDMRAYVISLYALDNLNMTSEGKGK